MERLFGTDGIRGKVGVYPLTEEMIFNIGRAAALYAKEENIHNRKSQRISIAKDTRTSGEMFEEQLIKGITSVGVDAIKLGILPTPCSAYLVKKQNYDMGIVISASHNDISDNGLKFFTHKGYKLSLQEEEEIEGLIAAETRGSDKTTQDSGREESVSALSQEEDISKTIETEGAAAESEEPQVAQPDNDITPEGKEKDEPKAMELYTALLKELTAGDDISKYKIAIDCAYGAASHLIPHIVKELGLNVVTVSDTPNGDNINAESGSLHPNVVSEVVIKEACDCGFAFDGDGDRVIACDERGQILDGDFILAIIAKYLSDRDLLNKKTIVTTQMSNLGLEMCVNQRGERLVKTDVGDKYVLEKMIKGKYNLGGEQSGHIILLDHTTTGDGILTALFMLKIMAEEGKSLKELSRCMYKFPQVLVNINVKHKKPIEEVPKLQKAISKCEKKLGSSGRLYVRYSGTEDKLRIMIEGQNQVQINELAEEVACLAKEELNA
ncbi:phosphoglucosamine mutase [Candidatus Omnitrophota bacterium]